MSGAGLEKSGWTPDQWPVLALGFRPFYIVAALFAAVAVPVWIASYTGYLQPAGYLRGIEWHSHEMIFGFAPAVIAGFLLTAVRNWTGLPTASGLGLASLVVLWLLGRVLVLTGPAQLATAIDILFIPVLGIGLAIPIWSSRNLRNIKVLVILSVLALLNIIYHAAHASLLPFEFKRIAIIAALDVITILMAVIAGRIIPAFTTGAIAGANLRRDPRVEVAVFGSLALVLIMGVLSFWIQIPTVIWAMLLMTAAIANGIRLAFWNPQQTYRNPLLWMLPVAYAWIPITFVLRALSQFSLVPHAVATHALTIGAMSSLMVAMMARSALGHTGRPLKAGPVEMIAFIGLQVAAFVRILAALVLPGQYINAMVIVAAIWFLAFSVFLFRYVPILTSARL